MEMPAMKTGGRERAVKKSEEPSAKNDFFESL